MEDNSALSVKLSLIQSEELCDTIKRIFSSLGEQLKNAGDLTDPAEVFGNAVQEYFEIKMNKPAGFLTSESRPLFDNKTGKGLTYLQRFMKSFYETTVLDLDSVEDELTYYLLLQSHPDKCANSENELTPFSRA